MDSNTMAFPPPHSDPFCPDFGQTPPVLVGRDKLRDTILKGLASGPMHQSYTMMLMGSRGSGKTVMMSTIEDIAAENGWIVLTVDAATTQLHERILLAIEEAKTNYDGFEAATLDARPTSALSGIGVIGFQLHKTVHDRTIPDWDTRHYLSALGRYAQKNKTSVLLTVDEMHGGDQTELRRLASDLQHIIKKAHLPVAFLGAGLSSMEHSLLQDKKMTFFQRCARLRMPALTTADAIRGLKHTTEQAGGYLHTDALRLAAAEVGVLPYKLQLLGSNAWTIANAPEGEIDLGVVQEAIPLTNEEMAKHLAIPAWYDLSDDERAYLKAVVVLGGKSTKSGIATILKMPGEEIVTIQNKLIANEYISQSAPGMIELSGVISSELVTHMVEEEAAYSIDYDTPETYAQIVDLTQPHTQPLCGAKMPRAKKTCVLNLNHAPPHRSKKPSK